ncbi:hypothetical protein BD769DRAFT_1346771 [Suillus cothurnatus]|nr:hypothetical protein BD769DRAFT_1346771 [Suillus cothurnatus]
MVSARETNFKPVFQAVDAGMPINITNDKGNTTLMLAACTDRRGLAEGLLQQKSDPNRLNSLGRSGAVFKSHDEVVCILGKTASGADPRIGKPTAIEAVRIFD